ncbi:DUF551 domain-containing protein [Escherichia coli]
MEYNEFDANVDARMNNSDIPRHSITQAQMIENDVAASEKKAPNERYKQISDIDYLGAMSAFHSDKWHKMGSITGYMHGWNACRAAMLQGSQPVSQNYKLNEPSGNSPVTPDGWISCSERMPNDAQWCVVNTKYGYYVQCWSEGQGWLGDDISIPECDVINWMPLPEPPQEVK